MAGTAVVAFPAPNLLSAAVTNAGGTVRGGYRVGDARLGKLQNNGGSTQTMLPAKDSAAVDAGDNGFSIDLKSDQRGDRFLRRQGVAVDLRAVEVR